MTHPLATHFLQRNLDATFFADNAAVFHPLIFTTQTFIIFDWAKDTRTKQTVTLGLERPVIDRFRLFYLAERP